MTDDLTPPHWGGPGYTSPYGKPRGLAQRLDEWAGRMGTDRSLPWAGLGIIGDLELAASILNRREWLESLRLSDDPEAQRFAAELLDDVDEWEAAEDAAAHIKSLPGEPHALPPVDTIERLDAENAAVRDVLVSCGALAPGDKDTPIADLVRALLS